MLPHYNPSLTGILGNEFSGPMVPLIFSGRRETRQQAETILDAIEAQLLLPIWP
jgi:hypothetical protein